MSFLDYVKIFAPWASVFTPFIFTAVVLWLKSQFVTKTEAAAARTEQATERLRVDGCFDSNARTLTDHDRRIALIEQSVAAPPSRHDLQQDITSLISRMSSVESEVRSVGRQLGTTNDYLSTLVERGLSGK